MQDDMNQARMRPALQVEIRTSDPIVQDAERPSIEDEVATVLTLRWASLDAKGKGRSRLIADG